MSLAYKAGVRIKRRTLALTVLENAALRTQEELGYPTTLVITSVNDSRHGTNSRHFKDEAIDIRTKGPASNDMGSAAKKWAFRKRMEELAGGQFRVLLEHLGTPNEHLHAQVKKGRAYP